jgi:hypothetical protein
MCNIATMVNDSHNLNFGTASVVTEHVFAYPFRQICPECRSPRFSFAFAFSFSFCILFSSASQHPFPFLAFSSLALSIFSVCTWTYINTRCASSPKTVHSVSSSFVRIPLNVALFLFRLTPSDHMTWYYRTLFSDWLLYFLFWLSLFPYINKPACIIICTLV